MDILISIIVILVLTVIILFEFAYIKSLKTEEKEVEPEVVEIPKKAELTDEQRKKQEELRENFNNLMGYGYEQALKSSKGE